MSEKKIKLPSGAEITPHHDHISKPIGAHPYRDEMPTRVWVGRTYYRPSETPGYHCHASAEKAAIFVHDKMYLSAAALRDLCERFRRPAFLKIADSLQAPASTAILTCVVELEKLLEGKD